MPHPIREMFDRIAGRYDFLNHFLSLGRDIKWRKKSIGQLGLSQTGSILDLCGGTGDFTDEAHRQLNISGKVVIADFSMGMLTEVRPKNVKGDPVQSDALRLPFKENSFDVVLCGFGMRNLSDLQKGLAEVARVLKPSGKMMVLEFFKPEGLWANFFYKILAPIFLPFVALLFGSKLGAYRYLVSSIKGFLSRREFADLCFKSDLTQVITTPLDGGLCAMVLAHKEPVEVIPWDAM